MKRLIFLLLFITSCITRNSWTCIEGDCENGEGTKVWSDNSLKTGHWINGKLNGEGFQTFGAASEFSGDTIQGALKTTNMKE